MYKRQTYAYTDDHDCANTCTFTVTVNSAVQLTCPEDMTAVSYTNLRAHETVLELVCRLLLEKKKVLYTTHLRIT